MANTNVFRGSDASLTLAPTDADMPEGAVAQEVIEFYQLSPVGRATGVEVYVQTELEEYHEIGKRHPAQLRPGNNHVSGTLQSHLNTERNADVLTRYDTCIICGFYCLICLIHISHNSQYYRNFLGIRQHLFPVIFTLLSLYSKDIERNCCCGC